MYIIITCWAIRKYENCPPPKRTCRRVSPVWFFHYAQWKYWKNRWRKGRNKLPPTSFTGTQLASRSYEHARKFVKTNKFFAPSLRLTQFYVSRKFQTRLRVHRDDDNDTNIIYIRYTNGCVCVCVCVCVQGTWHFDARNISRIYRVSDILVTELAVIRTRKSLLRFDIFQEIMTFFISFSPSIICTRAYMFI